MRVFISVVKVGWFGRLGRDPRNHVIVVVSFTESRSFLQGKALTLFGYRGNAILHGSDKEYVVLNPSAFGYITPKDPTPFPGGKKELYSNSI